MDYFIGALVIWAVVSLPLGILLGTLFNRMDRPPSTVERASQPFPMFTYVGPAPVMPLERSDYADDDEPPSRLN